MKKKVLVGFLLVLGVRTSATPADRESRVIEDGRIEYLSCVVDNQKGLLADLLTVDPKETNILGAPKTKSFKIRPEICGQIFAGVSESIGYHGAAVANVHLEANESGDFIVTGVTDVRPPDGPCKDRR